MQIIRITKEKLPIVFLFYENKQQKRVFMQILKNYKPSSLACQKFLDFKFLQQSTTL